MVGVWSVFINCKNKCCRKTLFTGYDAGFFPQAPKALPGKVWITAFLGTWKRPLVVYEVNNPHHYCGAFSACPDSSKVQHRTHNRCSINAAWMEFLLSKLLRKVSESQLFTPVSFKICPQNILCHKRNTFPSTEEDRRKPAKQEP